MAMKSCFLRVVFLSFVAAVSFTRAGEPEKIDWLPWSDKIFEQARAEQKYVLLDLGAGWCHWCHVMDELTYADPTVIGLLRSKFLAVRVDQDARPDLANRYEDYGWPATILFHFEGHELAKRRGYLPPKTMAGLLQAIIDDPTPGPSVLPEEAIAPSAESSLTPEERSAAREKFIAAYDAEDGGWGDAQHFLDWHALEYCLREGAAGDAKLEQMARQTLTAGLKLIDPVWGGVYQYSTDGDWDHAHFEKIMPFQAENLRVLTQAAQLWAEPKWLDAAQKIRAYLKLFLTSPDGAFYTSQDADVVPGEHSGEYFSLNDAARRKQGVPRVDRHLYARENGLAIMGLCALHDATGEAAVLAEARRAAEWALAHRAMPEGGFRHDEKDEAGPYLADTLAMGRAFLSLYHSTAERGWLEKAEQAATFIAAKFQIPLGFASTPALPPFQPKAQVEENIQLTRWAKSLYEHTGKSPYLQIAEHAMRFLAAPAVVASQGYGTSGILLADRELNSEPMHLTIVGPKTAPLARQLYVAALQHAPAGTRLEWLDASEGPLPRADAEYPSLPEPVAFLCKDGTCSRPMKSVAELVAKLPGKVPPKP